MKWREKLGLTAAVDSIALPTTGHRDSYRILVLTSALFTRVAGEELSVLHQTRATEQWVWRITSDSGTRE